MRLLLILATLLFATHALADAPPPSSTIFNQWAKEGLLCSAQAATGDCTSGGDEIVLDVRGYKTVTFDASDSTASTFVCDVYSAADGHDGSTIHQDVSATQITETAPILVIEGHLRYVWIGCSAVNADGVMNVWATASRF